jgi:hypothetical protein
MRFRCTVLLLAATVARAEGDASVRGLIGQLGHDDRNFRERAREALLALGSAASRHAMEALRHPDPEVRRGARAVWNVPSWAFAPRDAAYDPVTRHPREVVDRASCIRMLLVPAGAFEREGQRVVVRRPFYLGKYEVTLEEWDRVMAPADGPPVGPRLPVTQVLELDLDGFLARTGLRLPTEAEWELACRSGGAGDGARPLDDFAWHGLNSVRVLRPVGRRLPDRLGFHDLLGNVEELCDGPIEERTRPAWAFPAPADRFVVKGGSYLHHPTLLDPALRDAVVIPGEHAGLRPARHP